MKIEMTREPWAQALAEALGEEAARRLWPSLTSVEPRLLSAALVAALEHQFGPRAGQGVAVRVGQALFRHLPVERPASAGLPWRMSPVNQRVLQGLGWLLDEVTPALGLEAHVALGEGGWVVTATWCASCEHEAARPRCSLWQGFFQEALYWLTGRVYPVFLQACRSCGEEACRFFVPGQPLY